ncbi:hypothetical protein [Actinomadura sp. NBRC 104412]
MTGPAAPPDVPCVLFRPDGHVAWAGDDQRKLDGRSSRRFGVPAG